MHKTGRKQQKGKTRDLFRKTGDIKGTFCPKMGPKKEINGRDLVDAEEFKKRWKEYTEELSKKDLNVLDYCDGVVTTQSHLFWRVTSSGP